MMATAVIALSACSSSNDAGKEIKLPPAPHASSSSASATPSQSPSKSPSPTFSPTVHRTPTVTEVSPSASASKKTTAAADDKSCGDKSVREAVAASIGKVPEYFPSDNFSSLHNNPGSSWISEEENGGGYDPCADLSWVVLHTDGHSVAIPYQIMFFHKGEYIGTPAKVSFPIHPQIERKADDSVSVGYRWSEGTQSLAEAPVRAVSTFTYDPATGGVSHGGEWPSAMESSIIRADGTLPIDDVKGSGASNKAGGDIPADAIELSEDDPSFITPSGNISCDLGVEDPQCVVKSSKSTFRMKQGESGSVPVKSSIEGGSASLRKSDPSRMQLGYGETAYNGPLACTVEEVGVTCWSNQTGHGMFMSLDTSVTF